MTYAWFYFMDYCLSLPAPLGFGLYMLVGLTLIITFVALLAYALIVLSDLIFGS